VGEGVSGKWAYPIAGVTVLDRPRALTHRGSMHSRSHAFPGIDPILTKAEEVAQDAASQDARMSGIRSWISGKPV